MLCRALTTVMGFLVVLCCHQVQAANVYDNAVDSGKRLTDNLRRPGPPISPPEEFDFPLLGTWMWTRDKKDALDIIQEFGQPMGDLYAEKAISKETRNNLRIEWQHMLLNPDRPGWRHVNVFGRGVVIFVRTQPPEGRIRYPVHRWRDIAFLQFAELCREWKYSSESLHMIVMIVYPSNVVSSKVIQTALSRSNNEAPIAQGQVARIPPSEPAIGTSLPEPLELLTTYQAKLGRKLVKEVLVAPGVGKYQESYYVGFVLKPHSASEETTTGSGSTQSEAGSSKRPNEDAATDANKRLRPDEDTAGSQDAGAQENAYMAEKRQVSRRGGGHGDSSSGGSQNSTPTKGAAATYQKLVDKGKALAVQLESPIDCVTQATWTTAAFDKFGWAVSLDTFDIAGYISKELSDLLKEKAAPLVKTTNNWADWSHTKDVKQDEDGREVYRASRGYFRNCFCIGMIFGIDLRSPGYEAKRAQPPIKQAGLIPFRQWSDITFLSYKQYCKRQARAKGKLEQHSEVEKCLRSLQYVIMHNVVNTVTDKAIRTALTNSKQDFGSTSTHIFEAFPRTTGLRQFWEAPMAEALRGWKVVKEIVVVKAVKNVSYSLVFILADHPSEAGSSHQGVASEDDLVAGQGPQRSDSVRQPEKRTGTTDYENLVKKGKALADKLTSSHSVTESQWTSSEAFKQYGWERKPGSPSTSLSNVLNKPLQELLTQLDISLAETPDNHVLWQHFFDVPKISGGKEPYRATDGYYRHLFCLGAILALDLRGPAYEGSRLDPPIEGDDLIPFRHWSDVAFLAYKTYCEAQARAQSGDTGEKCLKQLKAVVQMTIINRETSRTILAALGVKDEHAITFPLQQTLQVYPSLSDGAAAVLASANAQGVVWLLAQHRQELGWKVIKEIVVIQRTKNADYSLLFVIENHPSTGSSAARVSKRGSGDYPAASKMLDKETYKETIKKGKVVLYFVEMPKSCAEPTESSSTNAFHRFGRGQQYPQAPIEPLTSARPEL